MMMFEQNFTRKRHLINGSWPLLLVFFAFTVLPVSYLQAADELYQGSAVVADQSSAEQEKGTLSALLQVLGKLSGLNQFEAYPELSPALSRAQSMVVAFYYENHPLLLPDGSSVEEKRLVVNFSPNAVDQLHTELQLPRWNPDRPPLKIWPIVAYGQDRTIMPIELEYAWAGMADLALSRGMPLRWPEADENGEYAVDLQLLWGGYTDEMGEQSPGETLIVAALQDGPEWNVRMSLDYEGLRWSERFRGSDLETVLKQGLNQAIDQVVAASSIAAADSGEWTVDIMVTQLTNAADYARCLAYLEGLSVVESVNVKNAEAGKVQFSLALNAAPQYLQQYLQSGKTLVAGASEGEYQLQP